MKWLVRLSASFAFFKYRLARAQYFNLFSFWRNSSSSTKTYTLLGTGSNFSGQLGIGNSSGQSTPVALSGSWQTVACGYSHTLAISADGTLWGWGTNFNHELGDGTTSTRSLPVQITSLSNWAAVAAGQEHSVGLRSDGTLWSWGNNSYGQLGVSASSSSAISTLSVPTLVTALSEWATAGAGGSHTIAVKTNGTLWAWGANSSFQVGDGTSINKTVPTQIGSSSNWRTAVGGAMHSVALDQSSAVWAWGSNFSDQVGDGTFSSRSVPVQVLSSSSPTSQIAAGGSHTLAIATNGTLWAWGSNSSGQLGTTSSSGSGSLVIQQVGSNSNWSQVAAGTQHSLGVRTDGTLWVWGSDSSGQLGEYVSNASVPTQLSVSSVSAWSFVAARADYSMLMHS